MPDNLPYYKPSEGALPPREVRFSELHIEPWPDGHRIRVHFTVTPFQVPPNLLVTVIDSQGIEIANVNIIEFVEEKMTFTLHLRSQEKIGGKYLLNANINYLESGVVDEYRLEFETSETPPD
jgi:hypothetical protein